MMQCCQNPAWIYLRSYMRAFTRTELWTNLHTLCKKMSYEINSPLCIHLFTILIFILLSNTL